MRHVLVVLAIVTAVLASATVASAVTIQGAVNQHQIGGSGINSKIQIADSGTVLTVTGQATGLLPGAVYFSLFYDNGSIPSGPSACLPSDTSITEEQMLIGFWHNNGDGTGTLNRTLPSADLGSQYVPLSLVHTMSIREASAGFALRACGEVHTLD